MKQTETTNLFQESFNNVAEEYEDELAALDDHSELAKNSSEYIEREFNVRLQKVMQISKSSVGLLFTSVQIFNDWHKLRESGLHLGESAIHLIALRANNRYALRVMFQFD